MTYDIYDFVGNGIVHHFKYGEAVKEITPYLNGVLNLHLQYDTLEGIILPIDEKTVYKQDKKIRSFYDFFPDESTFNAYMVCPFCVFTPKTPEKPSAVTLIMIDNKKIMQNFFIKK
mgnify:CR=1 FL=1